MPTPTSLLNTLRAASAYYMMSDNVRVLRSESWTDEYGGVVYRLHSCFHY